MRVNVAPAERVRGVFARVAVFDFASGLERRGGFLCRVPSDRKLDRRKRRSRRMRAVSSTEEVAEAASAFSEFRMGAPLARREVVIG